MQLKRKFACVQRLGNDKTQNHSLKINLLKKYFTVNNIRPPISTQYDLLLR